MMKIMETIPSCRSLYHSNPNIIKEMAKFLPAKDLCSLSLVSKSYHEISKAFDYRFKEESYQYFCSDYETFNLLSVEMKVDMNQILSSSSIACSCIKPVMDEEYNRPSCSYVSWKELFSNGLFLKQAWNTFNNDANHQDVLYLRNMVYDKLMESKSSPKLRIKDSVLENEFSSPLQKFLFDLLYDQQELYEVYNKIFLSIKFNCEMEGKDTIRKDIPFNYLITHYCFLKSRIKTEKDKLQLQYARWYYIIDTPDLEENKKKKNNQMHIDTPFDIDDIHSEDIEMDNVDVLAKTIMLNLKTVNNNKDKRSNKTKPIKITIDFIKEQLENEGNILFFILKCLCMTLMFHCQYTMTYLYHSFHSIDNPNILLSEYLKRYKNYVETAIDLNDQLENVNVAMNYLYESFFFNYPSFPKFSIFRMCMLIWNNEMNTLIDDNESMLSCIKMSFISLYSNTLHDDLDYYFRCSSYLNINDNESNSMLIKSTHSSSASYTLVTTGTGINIDNKNIQDRTSQYIILEQLLSSIMDTFCNEYTVFSLNQFKISSNSTYEEIEGNMMETIENEIAHYYQSKVVKGQVSFRSFVEDIIKYFSSGFYSERIITQLKRKIYNTIQQVFNKIVNKKIKTDFEEHLMILKTSHLRESEANEYLSNNPNTFKSMEIYNTLFERMTALTHSQIIIEYVIVRFMSSISSDKTASLVTKKCLDDWLNIENEKIIKKNKQIFKELDNRKIPTEFDEHQEMLLSLFQRPGIEAITQEQTYDNVSDPLEEYYDADINMLSEDLYNQYHLKIQ